MLPALADSVAFLFAFTGALFMAGVLGFLLGVAYAIHRQKNPR